MVWISVFPCSSLAHLFLLVHGIGPASMKISIPPLRNFSSGVAIPRACSPDAPLFLPAEARQKRTMRIFVSVSQFAET